MRVSLDCDNPFTFQVRNRLKYDRNTMIVSLGDPRSGKSESEKAIGRDVDIHDDFDHKHISFLPQDYMKQIRTFGEGHFIQFDEPGAEWSNRKFMSVENTMLNFTHITFGSKKINVGWAVPILRMQDVASRMLVKYTFTMIPNGPKGMSLFYANWVDKFSGKSGRTRYGMCWFAPAFPDKPEEEKEYLEMKKQYQDQSYEKYWNELIKRDKKEEEEEGSKVMEVKKAKMLRIMAEITKKPYKYKTKKGKWNYAKIGFDFEVNTLMARDIVNIMESK